MSGKSGLASCSGAMPAKPRRNASSGRQSPAPTAGGVQQSCAGINLTLDNVQLVPN